ncbi:unnamed protein product [Penicillium nalgiovense]|uniref:RING-type domain-containing protein n=1 Tax=Penicillium nalgiovense TaxID=60175 RepID=A0A1V6Z3H1_PENNA|nr:hypothetical protein PENNAL_c0004G07625 [Penicillium nalgiovense]CAG7946981.1 unnamed protein product [Penicillium nalgiovense]CAG7950135.1 unnamed protein product [Penicillium nalgiovense]CAG7967849.1 unnamed protein product [Penicillium nalgiovense]CAG8025556.1 unnamed protein product [Penicillium nalgiovense]
MDSSLAILPPWWPSISPSSSKHHSLTPGTGPEMNGNSGVQFMGARNKRTRREMPTENNESGDTAWEQHFHPRRSDHARSESTRLPPRRQRDGFDHRRPVMLSPGDNAVIDLTDGPDSPPQRNVTSFPDPLHTPHPNRPLRFPRDLMNHTSTATDGPAVIDLEAEPDPTDVSPNSADVQIVGSSSVRPRPIEPRYLDNHGIPMHFPPHTRRRRLPQGVPWSSFRRQGVSDLELLHSAYIHSEGVYGLDLPIQPVQPLRRSSYKGLSPAPEGFTRLLAEDDVPLCPNCQDELGAGEGLKQQIHIAKPCGHVYCGECAGNRSISKSKKAAAKTKPFSKCQVAGCNKPVSSPTAMYLLYL